MECTVASIFPFRPYVGDQISSSTSKRSLMASNGGASFVFDLVSDRMPSGCIKKAVNERDRVFEYFEHWP